MARKVKIQPHGIDNGLDDFQVVVKPHPGGSVNRFGIETKEEAVEIANDLAKRFDCFPPVDETG